MPACVCVFLCTGSRACPWVAGLGPAATVAVLVAQNPQSHQASLAGRAGPGAGHAGVWGGGWGRGGDDRINLMRPGTAEPLAQGPDVRRLEKDEQSFSDGSREGTAGSRPGGAGWGSAHSPEPDRPRAPLPWLPESPLLVPWSQVPWHVMQRRPREASPGWAPALLWQAPAPVRPPASLPPRVWHTQLGSRGPRWADQDLLNPIPSRARGQDAPCQSSRTACLHSPGAVDGCGTRQLCHLLPPGTRKLLFIPPSPSARAPPSCPSHPQGSSPWHLLSSLLP